ncbi:MAG: cation:proton antiporter subunit C [Thermodesulfobacteriota bacterium]
MDDLISLIVARYNYWVYIVLMMIGFYAMIVKRNLIKKIIGMGIFQTAIILFFISIGAKRGSTIPILIESHPGKEFVVHAADYINPLPHVLMLTAIVVSVATLGVALSLAVRIYQKYDTLEENIIHEKTMKVHSKKRG